MSAGCEGYREVQQQRVQKCETRQPRPPDQAPVRGPEPVEEKHCQGEGQIHPRGATWMGHHAQCALRHPARRHCPKASNQRHRFQGGQPKHQGHMEYGLE